MGARKREEKTMSTDDNCPNCIRATVMLPSLMIEKYGFVGKMCQYCAKELHEHMEKEREEKKN